MRLWTEGIVSQVKAFLPAGGRKTVVMAAAGRLWLGGKGKRKVPCKEKRSASEDNGRIPCGSVFLPQRYRGT